MERLLGIKQKVEEKRKDIVANRTSLINFNQITEIINISSQGDIDGSINGELDGKLYHVTIEKGNDDISITITCNDERGLKIDYATSEAARFCAAYLRFRYYLYSSDKSVQFDSSINVLSQEDFENDVTHILSELITPSDNNRKCIPWDDVPKCKYFMFSQSELQFIIKMLNDNYGTKGNQDDANCDRHSNSI